MFICITKVKQMHVIESLIGNADVCSIFHWDIVRTSSLNVSVVMVLFNVMMSTKVTAGLQCGDVSYVEISDVFVSRLKKHLVKYRYIILYLGNYIMWNHTFIGEWNSICRGLILFVAHVNVLCMFVEAIPSFVLSSLYSRVSYDSRASELV